MKGLLIAIVVALAINLPACGICGLGDHVDDQIMAELRWQRMVARGELTREECNWLKEGQVDLSALKAAGKLTRNDTGVNDEGIKK